MFKRRHKYWNTYTITVYNQRAVLDLQIAQRRATIYANNLRIIRTSCVHAQITLPVHTETLLYLWSPQWQTLDILKRSATTNLGPIEPEYRGFIYIKMRK
jgi:hypothetical protein